MPTYTGPIPPTPTSTSTDQQWQNWWNYQTVLTNLRYEDERAADKVAATARQAVLDQQHAQKMAAEAACAASNNALATSNQAVATAQQAMAVALLKPTPSTPRTDAELLLTYMLSHIETGTDSTSALAMAKADVIAYRKATAPAYTVPI